MNLLNWIIFLPTLTAFVVLALAQLRLASLPKILSVGAAGMNLLFSLVLVWNHIDTPFEDTLLSLTWINIGGFSITYTIGFDSVSLMMVALTNLLMVISILASWTAIKERQTEFYFFLMLLHTGINGTFLAFDLFLFYVFWELMLIPMFFLIGIWGSKNRLYATIKFVLFTLVGSLLMLVAVLYLYFWAANAGASNFTYQEILLTLQNPDTGAPLSVAAQSWMFLAFFLAFAIKVPLFPFHTWLPDAHTEAPTAGSIILAGVLLKTGAYGVLRFCLPFFPDAAVIWAPTICWLSVIAIIYGAATAIVQTDMKRLVAYSSISHMGFVMLGIFAFSEAGVTGAVMQMIGHGITTGGLFLGVGILYERRHTRLLADYGGVAGVMTKFTVLMFIIIFASAGLPGLNGFVGEFLILSGAFVSKSLAAINMEVIFTALAATGVVLGAVYLLIMAQRVFFGELTHEENKSLADLNPRELGAMLTLVFMAFWLGLYPKPVLDRIESSYTLATIESRMGDRYGDTIRVADQPDPDSELTADLVD